MERPGPLRSTPSPSESLDKGNDKPNVGAVVIGGDYQGLGIVRSLGRHNVPVCVIDDEHSISRFSKYATHAVKVPNLRDEQRTIDTLLEIGGRLNLEGWVLFPTRDETVAALSRQKTKLSQFFRVPTPAWQTIRWTWDKLNTRLLAKDLDIPTPRTWQSGDVEGFRKLDIEFPVAIKPAVKEHFIYAAKVKAWRADNWTELEACLAKALKHIPAEEIMIQELVPGGGNQQFAYCAFFKDNRSFASMVVRRIRQHPLEFGKSSTYVETTNSSVLKELSECFLKKIDYYGLVEMEYKLDPRNGQFKLLDVNARTWGYHTIGCPAGVDFPYMLFADQLGLPTEQLEAKPGVSWIRLLTDLPTGYLLVHRNGLHWKSYLRSVRDADIESVFSREDPLPGICELALIPYLAVKRGY
jgi:D-aspartate ligase